MTDSDAPREAASDDHEAAFAPPLRRRRGPIVALVVMAMAAWAMYATREDVAYFFTADEPVDLGDAKAVVEQIRLRHDTFARVSGTPDRKRALLIRGRWDTHRAVFRLHQTRSRLFVAQERKEAHEPVVLSDVFEGRLARFRDQDFFAQVYGYYSEQMTTTYDLDPRALLAHAGKSPAVLEERAGEEVLLGADRHVFVGVRFADEYRVQLDRERYVEAAEADRVVAELGLPWAFSEESSRFRVYVVRADAEAAARLIDRFRDIALKVGVVPRVGTYVARWGDIEARGERLLLRPAGATVPDTYVVQDGRLVASDAPPPYELPLERIRSVEVSAPFRVPMDAFVLFDGDRPGAYWPFVALDALLGLIILGNLIVLGLGFRRRR